MQVTVYQNKTFVGIKKSSVKYIIFFVILLNKYFEKKKVNKKYNDPPI